MKKNIAIIFGGASSEYQISLQSASSVIDNMNREKYETIMIGISRNGDWYHYTGEIKNIANDTWLNEKDCSALQVALSQTKAHFITSKGKEIYLDAAFPVLHGINGEDGSIQGLLQMLGIPCIGCGVLASALCMDKYRAHELVSKYGILCAKSKCFTKETIKDAKDFCKEIGLPVFVKPLRAGSSYGISKVKSLDELEKAFTLAFEYDSEIIVEENIQGFEVGCAVMGRENLTCGEVDEIEITSDFFDFTEKYESKTSLTHVPARLPQAKREEIKAIAEQIYRILDCCDFARVDLFVGPNQQIYFNEINTIPGFTSHSRFPSMMKAVGMPFKQVIEQLIEGRLTHENH